MLVQLITLEGYTFDLEFDNNVNLSAIRKKLFETYNFNAYQCYFYQNGKILSEETILGDLFSSNNTKNQIIVFNYRTYPDKSFARADDAFKFNFSRYSGDFCDSENFSDDLTPNENIDISTHLTNTSSEHFLSEEDYTNSFSSTDDVDQDEISTTNNNQSPQNENDSNDTTQNSITEQPEDDSTRQSSEMDRLNLQIQQHVQNGDINEQQLEELQRQLMHLQCEQIIQHQRLFESCHENFERRRNQLNEQLRIYERRRSQFDEENELIERQQTQFDELWHHLVQQQEQIQYQERQIQQREQIENEINDSNKQQRLEELAQQRHQFESQKNELENQLDQFRNLQQQFQIHKRNLQVRKDEFERQFDIFERQRQNEFQQQINRIERIQRTFHNYQNQLAQRQSEFERQRSQLQQTIAQQQQ